MSKQASNRKNFMILLTMHERHWEQICYHISFVLPERFIVFPVNPTNVEYNSRSWNTTQVFKFNIIIRNNHWLNILALHLHTDSAYWHSTRLHFKIRSTNLEKMLTFNCVDEVHPTICFQYNFNHLKILNLEKLSYRCSCVKFV